VKVFSVGPGQLNAWQHHPFPRHPRHPTSRSLPNLPYRRFQMTPIRVSSTCQSCLRHRFPASLLRPASRPYSSHLSTKSRQWRPLSTYNGINYRRGMVSMLWQPKKEATTKHSDISLGSLVGDDSRVLLKPNNLFHPMDQSPSPEIRKRAAMIKSIAFCPHPKHVDAHRLEHISFTCPDCGVPTYCSQEHWADDYENHLLICDTLREVNEDDHDLRSGRFFPEFEYPGEQLEEQLINMTNWDTLLYTRNFKAIDDDRHMRQVTKLLTYPMTVASFLHELSPYSLRYRLTAEGLRSLSGINPLYKVYLQVLSAVLIRP
jgi:hypothetical protein